MVKEDKTENIVSISIYFPSTWIDLEVDCSGCFARPSPPEHWLPTMREATDEILRTSLRQSLRNLLRRCRRRSIGSVEQGFRCQVPLLWPVVVKLVRPLFAASVLEQLLSATAFSGSGSWWGRLEGFFSLEIDDSEKESILKVTVRFLQA